MASRPDTEDYRALFLTDAPMMDMRAPLEFEKGAFPAATSLPLMTDDERAQVGTRYKQQGPEPPGRLSLLFSRRFAFANCAEVAA